MAAARLLLEKGALVGCSDSGGGAGIRERAAELEASGCRVECGGHTERFAAGTDIAVISPGIDPAAPLVRRLRESIPVVSEIELAFGFCRGRVIAVTGTNGKTTTVSLLERVLVEGGLDAVAGGNIGRPFSEIVSGGRDKGIVVLEVSSFQLEGVRRFSPWGAVVLNVAHDHLDRYAGFGDYVRAKAAVFRRQGAGAWTAVREEDKALWEKEGLGGPHTVITFGARRGPGEGAYCEGDELVIEREGRRETICRRQDLSLRGDHNVENVLAVALSASFCGVGMRTVKRAVRGFAGLAHRMELFLTAGGTRYINDSKATNPDAVVAALHSAGERIILIAGGKDKGFDYRGLREEIERKVVALVLTGEAAERMGSQLDGAADIHRENDFEGAVCRAVSLASRGDTVLLSPACSSFDRFRNFEERGDEFRRIVKGLVDNAGRAGDQGQGFEAERARK